MVRVVSPRLDLQGEERGERAWHKWVDGAGTLGSPLLTLGQLGSSRRGKHHRPCYGTLQTTQRQTAGHSDHQQMLVNHRFRPSQKSALLSSGENPAQ